VELGSAAPAAALQQSEGAGSKDDDDPYSPAVWEAAPVVLVDDHKKLSAMMHHMNSASIIGVDTEHSDAERAEAAGGKKRERVVALIQIAVPPTTTVSSARIYLVDPLHNAGRFALVRASMLHKVLEDVSVTKVMHDAREVRGRDRQRRQGSGFDRC